MKPARRALALVCLTLGLVGCDHATKVAARSYLGERGPVSLIRGLVELRYAENPDIAFSLSRSLPHELKPWLLSAAGIVFIAILIGAWWRRRERATTWQHLAAACIVAGALGNLIDRVTRGSVVDFVYIHHYAVFNVADVLIVLGAIAIAGERLRDARDV